MPDRLQTFRPPWLARKQQRQRAPDTARPSAAARGYCSPGWKAARREVLLRDGYQCRACLRVVSGKAAHVDHIIPKSKGGSDEVSNLRCLCVSCHSKHEGWRAANSTKTRP